MAVEQASTLQWEIDQLVKTGVYPSEKDVLRDALRALYAVKPQMKRKMVAKAYAAGDISLGKVAEILGVCQEEARDVLREMGVSLHLGPETTEELTTDIANAV